MTNYAKLMASRSVPQTEPLDTRQVPNHGGGFGYEVDIWTRLNRFLLIGSEAGTYYQNAKELTRENAKCVEECWLKDPALTAGLVSGISTAGRAPKNDAAIFALALGAVSSSAEARTWALRQVNAVCRTGTHLFQFVAMAMGLGKGFGRGMKRAVASWYTSKDVDKLAYQVVKYRSREKLTHENLLDLSHPKVEKGTERWLLGEWLLGRIKVEVPHPGAIMEHLFIDDVAMPHLVLAHEAAMKATTAKELLPILEANPSLPWEGLPTWSNSDPEVQKKLLPKMGFTAMVRQLGRLTSIGAIAPLSAEERIVVGRLSDEAEIKRSKIHPMQVLTALRVYDGGTGLSGGYGGYRAAPAKTWGVNQRIVDALDGAFYSAFQNVEKTGKRFFIGLDVSCSMSSPVAGSSTLSCVEAAAALSLVTVRTEPSTFVGRFNNGLEPVTFGAKSRLSDVMKQTKDINGGGTDCALPMIYALQKGIQADIFVVVTDNETNSRSSVHPMEALRRYREKTGISAKLVVLGMTATSISIADPKDAGCLDICGFDSAIPALISGFVIS